MVFKKFLVLLSILVVIPATSHAQSSKVVVGVGEITSTVPGRNPQNFQTILETELIKTNKFTVIERGRMAEVLQEQGLTLAGITESNVDRLGGLGGVDYLVYGAITKLGVNDGGVNALGLRFAKNKVEMAMDLRIVDIKSGRIVLAESIEREIEAGKAFDIGGITNRSTSGDPLSDAQRIVGRDIAGLVATRILPIKVAAVQGDTIILNYGDSVLNVGYQLAAFEVGEGFTDPDTGEVLGAEETLIGKVEVTEARSKFSKATIVEGSLPSVGDTLRIVATAEESKKKSKKKRRRKGRSIN